MSKLIVGQRVTTSNLKMETDRAGQIAVHLDVQAMTVMLLVVVVIGCRDHLLIIVIVTVAMGMCIHLVMIVMMRVLMRD